MADVVDEIKARISIEDIVSSYVQLKKAGRNFKGLCPFHSEKTPSFVVSPEKQICHCFGCNKGGDIFAFIQEVEGASFPEALEILADRAGVKVDTDKVKKKSDKSEKDIYFKAHELAADFFEEQLHKTSDGEKVLKYLYERGLNDETIREFKIGFAPDKYDALYPYLLQKGIPRDILIRSGLVSAKNLASDEVYDKYRLRLIFPIFDNLGRVCGFGGRALKKDQSPKYLNSPENPIYSKSKILYGFSHAKETIKKENKVLLVEGYFDVVMPYQVGIKNVVATSGIALSKDQARLLKRLTTEVVSCFDTDSAGFEASQRAYFVLQQERIFLKTVADLGEKDPADFVLEHGDKFKDLINDAVNFIDFFIKKLLKEHDIKTLDGRRRVIDELLPFYREMSAVERDFFVKEMATKLGMADKYLYEELDNYKLPTNHPAKTGMEVSVNSSKIETDELVLSLVLEHSALFSEIVEKIDKNDFSDKSKAVYKCLTDQYNSLREKFKVWDFSIGFSPEDRAKIDILRLYAEERYGSFSEESLSMELGKLIDRMAKDRKERNLKDIYSQISEAEKEVHLDKEKIKELLNRQQKLLGS